MQKVKIGDKVVILSNQYMNPQFTGAKEVREIYWENEEGQCIGVVADGESTYTWSHLPGTYRKVPDIDWSMAPEGTTHHATEEEPDSKWMKVTEDYTFFYDLSRQSWQPYTSQTVRDSHMRGAIPRPVEAQPTAAEISSDIKQANIDLLCEHLGRLMMAQRQVTMFNSDFSKALLEKETKAAMELADSLYRK